MWPAPRPPCVPSGILFHPTVWPQYTNVTDRTGQTDNGPIAQGEPFYKRLPKISLEEENNNVCPFDTKSGRAARPAQYKLRRKISAVSGPQFTVLWEHVEEILLLNKFFPIVDTCLSCEDIIRQSCAMVPSWRFFASYVLASRMQHVSDQHLKFALRPHHVSKYGRQPICDG